MKYERKPIPFITIEQYFSEKGHPVPKGAAIYYWPEPGVSDKGWFYYDANSTPNPLYQFIHGVWNPAPSLNYGEVEIDLLKGQMYEAIPINNLFVDRWSISRLPTFFLGEPAEVQP
jgi:hypothetical protein